MKFMQQVKGILIPIGGNEDKGIAENEIYPLEFIDDGILYHVVKEAGGVKASIVIIPTASSIPVEVGESYLEAFTTLGCKNISVLDIRSKEDSEKKSSIELIKNADCVMFSGGNQSNITNKIGGTTIHNILADRYKNEESFVIAGSPIFPTSSTFFPAVFKILQIKFAVVLLPLEPVTPIINPWVFSKKILVLVVNCVSLCFLRRTISV